MMLLPYENLYVISKLKPDRVVEKLLEVTSRDTGYSISLKGLNPNGPNTPFKGYVHINGFKFKPNIIGSNSYLPQIQGSIESYNEGSRVHIKMNMYVFMMIIQGVLLGACLFFCVKFFPHLISARHSEMDIIPFFIFLFLYLIMMYGFKSESIKAKSLLTDLLCD